MGTDLKGLGQSTTGCTMSFIKELKRRNVLRVAIAYAIVAWLLIEVSATTFPMLRLPEWTATLVTVLLLIGFPLALIFAWAYELTPEGVKPDKEVDRSESSSTVASRKLDFIIIGALVVALGYFVFTRDSSLPDEQSVELIILNRPMVAVLPFVNTSGNSAHDFLSLGLMDEIVVSLQRFKAFPVVSRSAILTFQRRDKSVTEIADELQAQYVVDSSIRANEDSLRVLVTMSDRNGDQIWADRFDLASDYEKLFSMTDEVAASIAGAVRDSEVERVEVVGRPPVAAWEHYIKGLSVILDWRRERHLEGRNHIERALELDPDMPEAWWALGEFESLEVMVSSTGEEESRTHLETSVDYFRRAHELSPFLGGACGCLGLSLEALNRVDEAFILLDEALEANPLSATLRIAYAQALANQGRFEEAVVMAESGARMEPMGRDLALAWLVKATADLTENRSDEARGNIYRAIYAHHRDVLVTPAATMILYVLGDRDAAARLYQEFIDEVPEFSFENLLTTATLKPIAKVIASRHNANPEFPLKVSTIVDELASQAATSAN